MLAGSGRDIAVYCLALQSGQRALEAVITSVDCSCDTIYPMIILSSSAECSHPSFSHHSAFIALAGRIVCSRVLVLSEDHISELALLKRISGAPTDSGIAICLAIHSGILFFARCIWLRCTAGLEALFEVVDNIVNMLIPHRNSDHVFGDSRICPFLL